MKNEYITFDSENHDFEFHDSYKDAKSHLEEIASDEGMICEAYVNGEFRIYKMIAKSGYDVTEHREDYCDCPDADGCTCDKEPWGYGDCETAGVGKVVPVEDDFEHLDDQALLDLFKRAEGAILARGLNADRNQIS
jgi:hypothetical protein